MNKQPKSASILPAAPVASLAVLVAVLALFGGNDQVLSPLPSIQAAPEESAVLTPTLVAWISSQSENIVEEMEAIVQQQVNAQKFSVVLYLRYLTLYERLRVVASKQHVNKFNWVAKKLRAFSKVRKSVYDMVEMYLQDLDQQIRQIEAKETKKKQAEVTKQWVTIYETIKYIVLYAPRGSSLVKDGTALLNFGEGEKNRDTRYHLHRDAFH